MTTEERLAELFAYRDHYAAKAAEPYRVRHDDFRNGWADLLAAVNRIIRRLGDDVDVKPATRDIKPESPVLDGPAQAVMPW